MSPTRVIIAVVGLLVLRPRSCQNELPAHLFRGSALSGSPEHLVFDRGHVGDQVAEGLCRLRALAREMGDHIPEVIDFLAKPRVLAD